METRAQLGVDLVVKFVIPVLAGAAATGAKAFMAFVIVTAPVDTANRNLTRKCRGVCGIYIYM